MDIRIIETHRALRALKQTFVFGTINKDIAEGELHPEDMTDGCNHCFTCPLSADLQ